MVLGAPMKAKTWNRVLLLSMPAIVIVVSFIVSRPDPRDREEFRRKLIDADSGLLDDNLGVARSPASTAIRTADSLISSEVFEHIHSDVTGPVDNWWRTPDYVTRATIQHVITPTTLRLLIQQRQLELLADELDSVYQLVDFLEAPESMQLLRHRLADPLASELLEYRGPFEAELVDSFSTIGKRLTEEYEAGESRSDRIKRMVDVSRALVRREIATRADGRRTSVRSFLLLEKPEPDLSLDATYEREMLRGSIILLQELCRAKLGAIVACQDLFADRVNGTRVQAFYDNLVGAWDSIVLLWESNGTSNLESALRERLASQVIDDEKISMLARRIQAQYEAMMVRVIGRIINESDLPKISEGSLQLAESLAFDRISNQVDVSENGLLRAQVLLGSVEGPLLALDAALIVGGIIAVPETGGLSLVATILGVFHLIVQTTVDTFAVSENQKRICTILCQFQNVIASNVISHSGRKSRVVGVQVTVDSKSSTSAVSKFEKSILGNAEFALDRLIGSAK